jgi:hypothetical protein
MSSQERTLGVSMLRAFERDQQLADNGQLVYPNLELVADEARQKEYPLLREFWSSKAGSVHEEDRAYQAALGYLVLTGLQLHQTSPEHQQLISDRYTKASIELYGQPDIFEYQKIADAKIAEFNAYSNNAWVSKSPNNRILKILKAHQITGTTEKFADTSDYDLAREEAAKRIAESLKIRYSDVLSVFDTKDPNKTISMDIVLKDYRKGLRILKSQDSAWRAWRIKPIDDRKTFASDGKEKVIIVGMARQPMTIAEARQKFVHEVLTHSLRSVNGSKTGESMMQYGLPDYLDAEEGLAVFIEYGLSGKIPNPRTDVYLDFGLALGTSGAHRLTRSQLQQLYVDREVVRREAKQERFKRVEIEQAGWRHVNRIFRGALDNDIIAVNTKDLAYYRGFMKIGDYITNALHGGTSEDKLLDYLMSGKFDPTNKRHALLVATLI